LDKIRGFHSILILNIPSYASGKNPWTSKDRFYEQSYSDGLIEILGFYTPDFALLQVSGMGGQSIAQANRVRIVTSSQLPMQVDGEPCLMEPCEIFIEKRNQVYMIHNSQRNDFIVKTALDKTDQVVQSAFDVLNMFKK
jgi:diacylglycerol kinase (ATP)